MSDATEDRELAAHVSEARIIDERHGEAFRLKRQGVKMAEIARAFGVDMRTVHRWLEKHKADYRRDLEQTPVVNMVADELAKLEEVEATARKLEANTKSDPAKRGYLNIALKALTARHSLLLDVGVLPREPTKIFSVIQEIGSKPSEAPEAERSTEQIRADLIELLKHARQLPD